MLDRLEKAKLIERRPHPTDRRGTIVVLSRAATRKLPAIFAPLAKAMEALVSSYTEKELSVLADFFSKAGVVWKEERQKLHGRSADRAQSGGRLSR
jgi:DNA-binding MarR family transcriptional regulator